MGQIHPGIPKQIALSVLDIHNLKWFIETGTGDGDTILWAADYFDHCITIELNYHFYRNVKKRVQEQHFDNVRCLQGDSETLLGETLCSLQGQSALVWLDAHWSPDRGRKPKARGISPLLAELSACRQWGAKCVLMIDDARLFGNEDDWPQLSEVESFLRGAWAWDIVEDVLIAEPIGTDGKLVYTDKDISDSNSDDELQNVYFDLLRSLKDIIRNRFGWPVKTKCPFISFRNPLEVDLGDGVKAWCSVERGMSNSKLIVGAIVDG
jgi:hypothetical protein